ncbi:MAG TPA: hypothetical protein VFA65_18430 [Bryobacteraceae bacterium]|nr:hypothetical protein [Bryobacteraceae bacterium]
MLYRIHRIKETPRENFRWAAHTGGLAIAKPKDYEAEGEIDAANPYAGWKALSAQGCPLRTGDILEELLPDGVPGALHIAKYVGFEKAAWFIPEAKTENHTISNSELS